jgi:hypothetical protein
VPSLLGGADGVVAMSVRESWLLIVVVVAVMVAFWKVLDFSVEALVAWWFDRHDDDDDVEPGADEPGQPPIGVGSSASS